MSIHYFTQRNNFWLYKVNDLSSYFCNLYRIGLSPESFYEEIDFENHHISHIYLDHRLRNRRLKKDTHFGTILYNGYNPIHLNLMYFHSI